MKTRQNDELLTNINNTCTDAVNADANTITDKQGTTINISA